MVCGELGRSHLNCIVKSRMIQFWSRIASENNVKLSTIIYKVMLHMYKNDSFKCKWIHHIESSLNNLGLGYIWFKSRL